MTRVGHLFDGSARWEHRVGASQLLAGLPSDQYELVPAVIESAARPPLGGLRLRPAPLPRHIGFNVFLGPAVARLVTNNRIDLIHAWGIRAAAAARSASDVPLAVHLFDPPAAAAPVRRLRSLARPRRFAVICDSQTVRRRLVEGGLPDELTVVIRPAVDFGLIRRGRRESRRADFGASERDLLALVPEPATREGGQFDAVWAVTLLARQDAAWRVVVPGASRETERIQRFVAALPLPAPVVTTNDRYQFEQLVAIADVLLVTPRTDIATTSVAWAMACGTTVVGTAVRSVAEMIAHKVNGLLFKHVRGRTMTPAIVRALTDRALHYRVREAARGQAYEVFGMRRYVEQVMRLYRNLLNDAPPAEGIADPATAV